MTTFRKGEVVVRRIEFGVEAGSDIGTVNKVQEFAWQDYCQRTGEVHYTDRSDDWCHVHPRDEEIVFAFEVEHSPDAAEQALIRAREALTELVRQWAAKPSGLEAHDFEALSDALGGAGVS